MRHNLNIRARSPDVTLYPQPQISVPEPNLASLGTGNQQKYQKVAITIETTARPSPPPPPAQRLGVVYYKCSLFVHTFWATITLIW